MQTAIASGTAMGAINVDEMVAVAVAIAKVGVTVASVVMGTLVPGSSTSMLPAN